MKSQSKSASPHFDDMQKKWMVLLFAFMATASDGKVVVYPFPETGTVKPDQEIEITFVVENKGKNDKKIRHPSQWNLELRYTDPDPFLLSPFTVYDPEEFQSLKPGEKITVVKKIKIPNREGIISIRISELKNKRCWIRIKN